MVATADTQIGVSAGPDFRGPRTSIFEPVRRFVRLVKETLASTPTDADTPKWIQGFGAWSGHLPERRSTVNQATQDSQSSTNSSNAA